MGGFIPPVAQVQITMCRMWPNMQRLIVYNCRNCLKENTLVHSYELKQKILCCVPQTLVCHQCSYRTNLDGLIYENGYCSIFSFTCSHCKRDTILSHEVVVLTSDKISGQLYFKVPETLSCGECGKTVIVNS